jgi:tRNA modification GTPase
LVSARSGEGLDELRARILQAAGWSSRAGESVFLARERHVRALERAQQHLQAASRELSRWEFFAEELRLAQKALGLITGEVTSDDLLGEIFGRFCIGK